MTTKSSNTRNLNFNTKLYPQFFIFRQLRNLSILFFVYLASTLLLSCSPDPCDDLICENGSDCSSGTCNCQDGFIGRVCQIEKIPSVVSISEIRIKEYPLLRPNGCSWDPVDGPDLAINIFIDDQIFYVDQFFYENAVPETDFIFEFDPEIEFLNTGEEFEIRLVDRTDFLGSPDIMDIGYFTPYIKGQKFPTTITLYGSNKLVAEITLSYLFN